MLSVIQDGHVSPLQSLQERLSERLQELSALSVQCDHLALSESASDAESMRLVLATLQSETAEFRLDNIQRLDRLSDALEGSSRHKREMDEYHHSVRDLQKLIAEAKQLAAQPAAAEASARLTEQQRLLKEVTCSSCCISFL